MSPTRLLLAAAAVALMSAPAALAQPAPAAPAPAAPAGYKPVVANGGVVDTLKLNGQFTVLTKALAAELSPHGITVNTIPPSIVDTPMAEQFTASGDFPGLAAVAAITPVRRVATGHDIAAACAFLCSEDAGFITGQQIGVNGGLYM